MKPRTSDFEWPVGIWRDEALRGPDRAPHGQSLDGREPGRWLPDDRHSHLIFYNLLMKFAWDSSWSPDFFP